MSDETVQAVIQWEAGKPDTMAPVHPDELCPCSKSNDGCIPYTDDDGCMCESELHCRPGRAHTPMGDG